MRRREFIAAFGAASAMPFVASAQENATRTIGWLSLRSANTDTETSILTAFRQGLTQTGYVEGRNLRIEFRFGEGQYERLPALAADLVRQQVAVLVTSGGTLIARVAQSATTTIPIIFSTANDPVQDGLVKSINRPGGNATGTHLINNTLVGKRLELLRELTPGVSLFGFLVNPNNNATTSHQIKLAEDAARSVGARLQVLSAATPNEIDAAFESLSKSRAGALVMGADPFFQVRQDQVIALAARDRVPTIYEWPEFVRAGGLMAYSVDRIEMWRQMGVYVSRILNGANPAELPVMQPTKFELLINLKTAKALGLEVPALLQQRADEVIE